MTLFCFFLTLVPSNNVQSWNFDQRHPNNTNILIEKSLKILKFCSNGTNWTSTDLVRFGAQFVAGKPKILLKSKISPKTASLGISNNVSARSQNKNHRILVKLSKKKQTNNWWPNWVYISLMGLGQCIIRNSHIAYIRTFNLYFMHAKFQLLNICSSQLYPEETTMFLVHDPTGSISVSLRQ